MTDPLNSPPEGRWAALARLADRWTPPRRARGLVGDTIVYGLGGAASRIVALVFTPIFTRIFVLADYGALDILATVVSLLTLLAMLGLNSAVFYYYRRTDHAHEPERIVGTAVIMATSLAILLAVGGILVAPQFTDAVLGDRSFLWPVILNFAWLPVNVCSSMLLDLLRLQFRPVAYSAVGIVRQLVAGSVGVVLAVNGLGISGILIAQLALGLAAIAVVIYLTRGGWSIRVDATAVRPMLRFGLPLVPTGLAYWVLSFSDRYFVLAFSSLAAVGLYSIANRIAAVMQLATFAFQSAWWPFAYARAEEPGHREQFARVMLIVSAGFALVAVGLGMFAREALILLTPPAYVPAYPYVGLLAGALAVNGVYQVIGIGAALARKTEHMAWTSATAAAINLACNIVLIPAFGIAGAAASTVLAYVVSTALLFIAAQRVYPIPYQLRPVLGMTMGAAAALAAGLVADSLAPGGAGWAPQVTVAKAILYGLFGATIWVLLSHGLRSGSVAGAREGR